MSDYTKKLFNFLEQHRNTDQEIKPTHLAYGPFNGKFYVDKKDYKEFMALYTEALENGATDLHILERPQEYGPIIVDIDIQAGPEAEGRLYNKKMIKKVIKHYVKAVETYVQVPEDYKICLFEKEKPTKKENTFKDGFHMMFADICTSAEIRHLIRNQVVKACEEEKLFEGFSNTTDQIIDKAVVSSNSWFLYGSRKPGATPYTLTKMFNREAETIYRHKAGKKGKFTDAELIEYFSIRSKRFSEKKATPLTGVEVPVEKKQEKPENAEDNENFKTGPIDQYREPLNKISVDRVGDYEGWRNTGYAINTLNFKFDEKVDLYLEVSRRHPNYRNQTRQACVDQLKKIPRTVGGKKITWGTILFWFKQDDPEGYRQWYNKWIAKSKAEEISVIHPSEYWKVEQINERYLPKINIEKGFTIIQSHLGTGKTTFITDYIKQNMDKRIIILTPREMYAKNIYSELKKANLEFKFYQNYKDSKGDKVVVQMESLHKYDQYEFDIVIMDECESILKQLGSLTTHRHNFYYNCNTFETLIKNANNIIMADAFVTNRSRDFVDEFKKPVKYVDNIFNPYKRKAIQYDDFLVFANQLIESLKKGKKIVAFFSSKARADKFLLTPKFRDLKVKYLYYNSESDKQTVETIKNVNEEWSKVDLLIYTAKITVGVNYNLSHFDEMFIYHTCDGSTVRDVFQASLRVREIKSNTLHYYNEQNNIRCKGHHYDDINDIEYDLERNKYHLLEYQKTQKTSIIPEDFVKLPDWLKKVTLRNILEDNVNKNECVKVFELYLKKCGYTLRLDATSFEKCCKAEKKEMFKLNNEMKEVKTILEYNEIKDISDIEYRELKAKVEEFYDLSIKEKYEMKKYLFNQRFNSNVDKTTLSQIFDNFVSDKSTEHYFKNLVTEAFKKEKDVYERSVRNNPFLELSSLNFKKLEEIRKIRKLLGLKSSTDNKDIKKSKLEQALNYCADNIVNLSEIFNIRDQRQNKEEKPSTFRSQLELLNKIFAKWHNGSLTNKAREEDKKEKKGKKKSYRMDMTYDIINLLKSKEIKEDQPDFIDDKPIEQPKKVEQKRKLPETVMEFCKCATPKYELVKANNEHFCTCCNHWKTRDTTNKQVEHQHLKAK